MSVRTVIFLSSSLSRGASFLPKPRTLDSMELTSLRMRMQAERTSSQCSSFWWQTHWFCRIARYSITSSFSSNSLRHRPQAYNASWTRPSRTRLAAVSFQVRTVAFACFFRTVPRNYLRSLSSELTVSPRRISSSASGSCASSSCALALRQWSLSRRRVESLSSLVEDTLNLTIFLIASVAVAMACWCYLVLLRQRTLLERAYSLWSMRMARSYWARAAGMLLSFTISSPLSLCSSDCSRRSSCARHEDTYPRTSSLTSSSLTSCRSDRAAGISPFQARQMALRDLILAMVSLECAWSSSELGSSSCRREREWSQSLMASWSLKSLRRARLRLRNALVSLESRRMASEQASTAAVQLRSLKKESPLSLSQRGFLDSRSPGAALAVLALGMGGSFCGKVSRAARLGYAR